MPNKQFISFVIVLHLLVSNLKAQPFVAFPLAYENTSPKIHQLIQLRSGYIITATSAGLFRFDGISFHRYTHLTDKSINVTAVCQLNDDAIWIGFADGKLGILKHNTVAMMNLEEGFPTATIHKIIQDKNGVVWLATAGEGLYCYVNKRLYNINTDDGLSDDYVYDLAVNENGVVAVTDKGINAVSFFSGKKHIRKFTSKDGLKDNIVTKITGLANNRFFIAMQSQGLGLFNTTAGKLHVDHHSNWSDKSITAILKTTKNIYIATDKNSVFVFPAAGSLAFDKAFSSYRIDGKISAMLQDNQGNLWAAADHQLVRFGNEQLQSLFDIGAHSNIHCLMVDKENHVWYNVNQTIKHCSQNNDGSRTTQSYVLPISKNVSVTALYEDQFENVWVGTMGGGVWRLNPYTKQIRKITEDALLQQASVLSISGRDNIVWIASLEGAIQCTLQKENQQIAANLQFRDFTAMTGIGSNYIYSIFVDSKKRVWFATDGKGLTVWDGKKYINYNQKNGLPDEVIYKIAEDSKGIIWCTTFKGGLIQFDGKHFSAVTTKEGLSDINIAAITIDPYNNLFIPHKKGVDVYNTVNKQFLYLNSQNGIMNVESDLNCLTVNRAGQVYFVADNHIYNYHSLFKAKSPSVCLDNIQLYLKDTIVSDGVKFSYDENNISFCFTGLDYNQPQQITYQYQLVGYANSWITTKDNTVNFPKLSPGKYQFRVRASLNNNFENASITIFHFEIKKPIWQQWWFVTIAVFIVVLVLRYFIKDRESRLKKWESLEREKIQSQFETLRNQINPHFLFNSFNTLIAEIEENPQQAVEYVEHLSDFYRSIVVYREKETIPLSEEFDLMKNYYYIQQKRYGNALIVTTQTNQTYINNYLIAPLTLQLLLENAVKHNAVSSETPLLVSIDVKENWLTVQNNINPKLTKEESSGLGLQNIVKRYLLLTNIAIKVESTSDSFAVSVPLISNNK